MGRKLMLLLAICVFFLNPSSVRCLEPATVEQDADKMLDNLARQQWDAIDTTQLDKVVQELNREMSPYLPSLNRETIWKLLRGEGKEWHPGSIVRGLVRYFLHEVVQGAGLLARLVVLAVMASVLYNLQASFSNAQVARIAYAIVFLALLGLALASFHLSVQLGLEAVGKMVSFMQAILPLLITLLAGSGAILSAGLFNPFVIAITYLTSQLVTKWVMPMLFLSGIIDLTTGFSENIRLTGLAKTLRQGGMVVLGVGLSLFLGIMAVYGVAGSVGDGTAMRAAKFLAKTMVPVVGGMFSDAAELVATSSLLLRNGVGLLGLVAILFLVAVPILKLISLILVYRLAAAAIQPLGGQAMAACLDGLASTVVLITVSLGAVAVMFFMTLSAVVGAGNAAVMFR